MPPFSNNWVRPLVKRRKGDRYWEDFLERGWSEPGHREPARLGHKQESQKKRETQIMEALSLGLNQLQGNYVSLDCLACELGWWAQVPVEAMRP
jgi:hypothetical protein